MPRRCASARIGCSRSALDDRLPNFRIHLDRMDCGGRSGAGDDPQRLSRVRCAVSFALAALRREWDNRWAAIADQNPFGPIAPRGRGLNSIWPSSASSSTPAPVPRGATAIRQPASASDVRRAWVWRALRCSPAALFSADPRSIRLRADADVLAHISALPTFERGLQVSDDQSAGRTLKAASICCAASARWWPPSRTSSAGHDTPRPGGLFDRLASLANGRQLPAPTILIELLQQLGPIWPSRLTLGGIRARRLLEDIRH